MVLTSPALFVTVSVIVKSPPDGNCTSGFGTFGLGENATGGTELYWNVKVFPFGSVVADASRCRGLVTTWILLPVVAGSAGTITIDGAPEVPGGVTGLGGKVRVPDADAEKSTTVPAMTTTALLTFAGLSVV